MTETAKKYDLLEQETVRFVQDLVAQAVEPPIERFRESAAKALESPAARLAETREAVLQAADSLVARIGSRLDSLPETVEEALEDVARRKDLERLREGEEEGRRLLEGVLEGLARLSTSSRADLENLARHTAQIAASLQRLERASADLPRRLSEGLAGLAAQLQAREEESAEPAGPAVASLETGILFLQQRSQASLEHFRALGTQIHDLRAEVATVQAQLHSLRTLTESSPPDAIQRLEERLSQQVQDEAARLRKTYFLSFLSNGLLFVVLVLLLLVIIGQG